MNVIENKLVFSLLISLPYYVMKPAEKWVLNFLKKKEINKKINVAKMTLYITRMKQVISDDTPLIPSRKH